MVRPSVARYQNKMGVYEAVKRYPTSNPRILGSVLNGTDQDGSDLDILVDALPGAILFDLGCLQEELESLLGIKVDLSTPTDLPIKFRDQVLAHAKPI